MWTTCDAPVWWADASALHNGDGDCLELRAFDLPRPDPDRLVIAT